MRIVWLPAALANRRSQLDWLAERNLRAAIDMGDRVDAALLRLMDFPDSGPPGRVVGTREMVVAQTPYIIVYRVEADTVVVLRLLHGRQQWPGAG